MEFPCQSCGSCCKVIGQMVTDARAAVKDKKTKRLPVDFAVLVMMAQFPYKFDESGKCEMLTGANRCAVYTKRPIICNVKKMFKTVYSRQFTFKQFCNVNTQMCNMMRGEANGKED